MSSSNSKIKRKPRVLVLIKLIENPIYVARKAIKNNLKGKIRSWNWGFSEYPILEISGENSCVYRFL